MPLPKSVAGAPKTVRSESRFARILRPAGVGLGLELTGVSNRTEPVNLITPEVEAVKNPRAIRSVASVRDRSPNQAGVRCLNIRSVSAGRTQPAVLRHVLVRKQGSSNAGSNRVGQGLVAGRSKMDVIRTLQFGQARKNIGVQIIDRNRIFLHQPHGEGIQRQFGVLDSAPRPSWNRGGGGKNQLGPGSFQARNNPAHMPLIRRKGPDSVPARHGVIVPLLVHVFYVPKAVIEMNDGPISGLEPSVEVGERIAGVESPFPAVMDVGASP